MRNRTFLLSILSLLVITFFLGSGCAKKRESIPPDAGATEEFMEGVEVNIEGQVVEITTDGVTGFTILEHSETAQQGVYRAAVSFSYDTGSDSYLIKGTALYKSNAPGKSELLQMEIEEVTAE